MTGYLDIVVPLAITGAGVVTGLLLRAGATCYLAGPFGITVLFNVPLNNELAQAGAGEANDAWPSYQKRWQRWNHIRTYVGILSIALLSFGLANP